MKPTLLAVAFVLYSFVSFGQTPTENARELLKLSGTAEMAQQVMSQMIESYKKAMPDVPVEFWTQMQKETSNIDKLVDMVLPIYVKYYTNDELLQLLQFYKSPIGRTMVRKTPLITQESYVIGQKWGQEVAAAIMKRIEEQGKK